MLFRSTFSGFDFSQIWFMPSADYFPILLSVYQPVTSIEIFELMILPGENRSVTVSFNPERPTIQVCTWTTSNPSVASVDAKGLVTGHKGGTAIITAQSIDGGCIASCTVTVRSTSIDSSVYSVSRSCGMITGLSINTSVAQFIANLQYTAAEIIVYDKNGYEYQGEQLATGMTAKLFIDSAVMDELKISVCGDISGDGLIDISDILYIRASILNTYAMQYWQGFAADINDDNIIDISDILYVRAHILGTYTIHAK